MTNPKQDPFVYEEDRYEGMLEQAVRFLDRLSNLVILAETNLRTKAINGRNVVVRANGLQEVSVDMQKLVKETKDWHVVIETMKQGKDVHIKENCKHNKLEIVAGSAHEFGQYIINQSSPKFCEKNTEGKDYMEKVNGK
jgi:uncharacterized protein (DUF2344 family)|tara:strand:+ start:361 stop:777 length:417 start_codon:yes stop_codon:yes gene_type:complete